MLSRAAATSGSLSGGGVVAQAQSMRAQASAMAEGMVICMTPPWRSQAAISAAAPNAKVVPRPWASKALLWRRPDTAALSSRAQRAGGGPALWL